jgi:hypothetical protein
LNALLQLPNKHATRYTKLLNEEGCSCGSVQEEETFLTAVNEEGCSCGSVQEEETFLTAVNEEGCSCTSMHHCTQAAIIKKVFGTLYDL